MSVDISVIWLAITVLATLVYIMIDGLDLGIRMLLSVAHDDEEYDVMISSVALA